MILSETGKKGAHFHTFFPCHFTAFCPAAPGGWTGRLRRGHKMLCPAAFRVFLPFHSSDGENFSRNSGEKAVFAGILAPSGRARWKSLPFPSGGMGITRWKRWKTCIFTVDCTECKILSKTARLSAARLTGKGGGDGLFFMQKAVFSPSRFCLSPPENPGENRLPGQKLFTFFPLQNRPKYSIVEKNCGYRRQLSGRSNRISSPFFCAYLTV